MTGTQN